jgi:hypothetical protein
LLLSQEIIELNTRDWFFFSHLFDVPVMRSIGSQKNERPKKLF